MVLLMMAKPFPLLEGEVTRLSQRRSFMSAGQLVKRTCNSHPQGLPKGITATAHYTDGKENVLAKQV